MQFERERVRANVQGAATEDLLDRATVFRAGMEPEALDLIEQELQRRGVRPEQIEEHARRRDQEVILLPDGTAARCSRCRLPAVATGPGWYRLWGLVPLFPQQYYYCAEHRPKR